MMIGWVIWVEISGQSDILVLADVPHPLQIRIALNMNPIEQNHFKRGHQVHFTILPSPLSSTIIRFYAWTGNCEFQFQMDMDIWTRTPSATPYQPTKEWNAHFWIMFISDDRLGWSMDSNPIHHPSPARKMKCSFCDYVQILMMGQAGRWTGTLSATPLQPKKWNDHFWITFNFWWWAGLVIGLKPHPSPLSSQKNEMLIFGLCSTSDDWLGCFMDSNPIHHPSPAKKWNAHSWIMFNFWWLAGLLHGL